MADLQSIIEQMEVLLEAQGYTVYDVTEWGKKKVSQRPESEFPIIFIGRGTETIDNTGESSLYDLLDTAEIDLNVLLATGEDDLFADSATEIRKIKDIIYTNRCLSNFWSDWVMDDNDVVQLATSNSQSKIFGGININTTVQYREQQIEGVL